MPKRGREREKKRERGINSHISADFNGAANEPQPAAAAVHFNELLPFKYNFIMARQTNSSRAGQQRQTAVELPVKKRIFWVYETNLNVQPYPDF